MERQEALWNKTSVRFVWGTFIFIFFLWVEALRAPAGLSRLRAPWPWPAPGQPQPWPSPVPQQVPVAPWSPGPASHGASTLPSHRDLGRSAGLCSVGVHEAHGMASLFLISLCDHAGSEQSSKHFQSQPLCRQGKRYCENSSAFSLGLTEALEVKHRLQLISKAFESRPSTIYVMFSHSLCSLQSCQNCHS